MKKLILIIAVFALFNEISIYYTLGECVLSVETGLRPASSMVNARGIYFIKAGGEVARFVKI